MMCIWNDNKYQSLRNKYYKNYGGGSNATMIILENIPPFLNFFFQFVEAGGQTVSQEPLELTLASSGTGTTTPPIMAVTLTFHGHYNEPSVCLNCPLEDSKVYDLTYDLSNAAAGWNITEREQ